jgi:hypothetical protein
VASTMKNGDTRTPTHGGCCGGFAGEASLGTLKRMAQRLRVGTARLLGGAVSVPLGSVAGLSSGRGGAAVGGS